MSSFDSTKRFALAVFAPSLQGAFIGELVNQIRHLCSISDIYFIGFSTGGLSSYDCDLNVDDVDAAILIRNSVSDDFARSLVDKGVKTVSIAHDYTAFGIPLVSSNNEKGAELALNYLVQKGHKTISFVGDLSHYDLQKRYDRYAELMQEFEMDLDEDLFIAAKNTDLSGGLDAGDQFIQRGAIQPRVFCGGGIHSHWIPLGVYKITASN